MKVERLTEIKKLLDLAGGMPDELAKNLHQWFRVELTYTSNALEGNTLTRRETAMVVEKGITVGGKSLVEHLEATNHAQAFDWIAEKARKPLKHFTENDLLSLHKMILSGIDKHSAGFYRNVPVRLSGSRTVLPNPRKVPDLMSAFHKWLQTTKKIHPVDLAAEVHYRLVTIHPFIDGNGRTARLFMNLIIMCHVIRLRSFAKTNGVNIWMLWKKHRLVVHLMIIRNSFIVRLIAPLLFMCKPPQEKAISCPSLMTPCYVLVNWPSKRE